MKRRILLLEDHEDTRVMMAAILRRSGYEVFARSKVGDAIDHIEHCNADIAVLDVRLPDEPGDEFGQRLAERCPGTRILFVTGEADTDRLKEIVPECVVLRKPVDVPVLLSVVATLLAPNP